MNNDVNNVNNVQNNQTPYIPINSVQVSTPVVQGQVQEPFKKEINKKKLVGIVAIVVIGLVAVCMIFSSLLNAGKLNLNYKYINSVDKNIYIVFKENNECIYRDYSVTYCTYEKSFDSVLVDVTLTYGKKKLTFKLKSDDKIELNNEITKILEGEYIDESVITFNREEKEYVSTTKEVVDESLYDNYDYGSVIPSTVKKTTTRYGYTTKRTTTFYRTTKEPISGLDDYMSKNSTYITIPGYSFSYDYAETYYIENGNVYALLDPNNPHTYNYDYKVKVLGGEDVVNLLHVRNIYTNDYYLFARKTDGSLHYINNLIRSRYSPFTTVYVPNVRNIKRGYLSSTSLYLYDDDGRAYSNIDIDRRI